MVCVKYRKVIETSLQMIPDVIFNLKKRREGYNFLKNSEISKSIVNWQVLNYKYSNASFKIMNSLILGYLQFL